MIMLTVWAAAVCLTAYLVWFLRLTANLSGPRVWPVVGSLPGLIQNKNRLHDWIADSLRSSGGTYQTCVCAMPLLAQRQGLVTVTCDPRNLEHILKTRFKNYPKGSAWHAVFRDLLGDGIFNSDGDTWLHQRKTAAPEFSTRTLRAAMSRWVSRSIHDSLLPILDAAAANEFSSVDLQDLLLRLTFDNICGLTFGRNPETLAKSTESEFAAAFDHATEATLQRLILPRALWILKKWFRLGTESSLPRSIFLIKQHLRSVIKVRKLELSAGHDDLLSRFLRSSPPPSDDFLCDLSLNFILAGRDTSSVALSWFFWLVSTHPAAELSLLRELRSTIHPLSFDELDRLVYLKAALSEALRLYPSVPEDTKHVAADDVLPDGTFCPRGSSVTYSIYSVGRMKSVWGEDCLLFRPERWLSPDGSRFEPPADPFRFMAFNAGPRLCLGKDLAYLQMKSIAATVIPRYRFDVEPGHFVEQKMSLTLFMKRGLRVRVRRRLESELT